MNSSFWYPKLAKQREGGGGSGEFFPFSAHVLFNPSVLDWLQIHKDRHLFAPEDNKAEVWVVYGAALSHIVC